MVYNDLLLTGCEDSRGRISSNWIKQNAASDIAQLIFDQTQFLPVDTPLRLRVLAIKQNITCHPLCYCGNPVMFHPTKTSSQLFADCCSASCARKNPARTTKMQQTNIERYGTSYHQTSPEGKIARQQTNIERYGHVSPAHNAAIRDKIKQTNIERYGHENIFGSAYGKDKIKQTNTERYGHISFNSSTLSNTTMQRLNDADWLKHKNHIEHKTLAEIAQELDCSISCVHQHFQHHGINVHRQQTSMFERDVCQWLDNIGITYRTNVTIRNVSYDIVIDSHNIILECDGIYWHGESTAGRGRNYHISKTQSAAAGGYQLIHVFEHEWMLNQDLVTSMIAHKLGQSERVIYGRNTEVRCVPTSTSKSFLQTNHIQGGNVARPIAYGLYHNNQLVSLITLSKNRFGGDGGYEITRFCSLRRTSVIGAFSKLFKHVTQQHSDITHIITFADSRWSTGSVYSKTGFEFAGVTPPSYYYFKTNNCLQLHNRQQFQKHKLAGKLKSFDPNLSEWKNMVNNGYDRIWDCGNTKWIWRRPA